MYCGVCRDYYEEYLDVTIRSIFSMWNQQSIKTNCNSPTFKSILSASVKSFKISTAILTCSIYKKVFQFKQKSMMTKTLHKALSSTKRIKTKKSEKFLWFLEQSGNKHKKDWFLLTMKSKFVPETFIKKTLWLFYWIKYEKSL